jgi:hypothetical protein
MHLPDTAWIFIIIAILSMSLLIPYIRFTHAILYENGTCTNANLTKVANQLKNTNRSLGGFFINLTSDNRQLAELMCHNILNETTVK